MPDMTTDKEYFYQVDTDTQTKEVVTTTDIKEWKLNRNKLRDNIISQIETEKIALPAYHITLSYFDDYRNRDIIIQQHRYIRNQMEEIFNRRYRNRSDKSSILFFIERHKSYLADSIGNTYNLFNRVKTDRKVKNTITNIMEYDYVDSEIRMGAYHSHILKSDIPDEVIFSPHSKLKNLMRETIGFDTIPDNDISMAAMETYKIKLLEEVCRRSKIVGNSRASIKVVKENADAYYDGYYGWKGLISYSTKTCYNAYKMMEVIDNDNSSLSLFPDRKPIKEAIKKGILPTDNEDKP